MRLTSIFKFLAAATGLVLPTIPVAACIGFRGVEAFELLRHFTSLGLIALLWTIAYLYASVVAIFQIGRRNIKWSERMVDAANTVMAVVLAVECADRQIEWARHMSYLARFSLWLIACLVAQHTFTHASRSALDVSRRIRRQLVAQQKQNKIILKPTKEALLVPVQNLEPVTSGAEPIADKATSAEGNGVLVS